jgi:hypothetical protein
LPGGSRGLGDVYKRQELVNMNTCLETAIHLRLLKLTQGLGK